MKTKDKDTIHTMNTMPNQIQNQNPVNLVNPVSSPRPVNFTQHALEQFIKRVGLTPKRQERAMLRFERFIARAHFARIERKGRQVWLSRGFVLYVRDGTVHTVFKPSANNRAFFYGISRSGSVLSVSPTSVNSVSRPEKKGAPRG